MPISHHNTVFHYHSPKQNNSQQTPRSAHNQLACFPSPSNVQDTLFTGSRKKQNTSVSDEAESSAFTRIEDSFFLRPRYERNPFAEKSDELENNPEYRRQAKAYEARLNNSTGAKVTKVVVNSTLGYGLLQLINITDSPVLGIIAGCTTGLYAEPISRGIVKIWEAPPSRVQEKETLDKLDQEIRNGKLVKTVSQDWRKRSRHQAGDPFQTVLSTLPRTGQNQDLDETATLLGTALISRYSEHQDALKSTLPELRGTYHTRKKILPALERAVSSSDYQACQPILSPALEKGIQDMLRYGELEHQHLHTPFRDNEENQRYERHLLQKLPDIVEYLEQD